MAKRVVLIRHDAAQHDRLMGLLGRPFGGI